MEPVATYTVFAGERLLVTGDLPTILARTKDHLGAADGSSVLIFEDASGRQVEFDFSGTRDEVLEREAPRPRSGPGRPKLGVVSREISLLPRHWEWLEREPNGISAALRRLVDEASKREPDKQRARRTRDATSKVMSVLAGNRPGFEEALRALYANEKERFGKLVRKWPSDIRAHLLRLAEGAFVEET